MPQPSANAHSPGMHCELPHARAKESLVAWTLRTEGAARKQRAEAVEVLQPMMYLLHLERHLLQDA